MAKDLVANLYNPHEQSKEQLIESFAVRHKVFEKLFKDLRTAPMQYPEQHIIIEGQRGSGKTTLLLRLSYAIENHEALNTWLIPMVFKEEAYYGISDLAQLWEATAQYLEEKDEAFAGLAWQMAEAYDEGRDYERSCFEKMVTALDSHHKKIILFIDNFGELLRGFDAFNDTISHRFREVLMTCPHLRVVGATSVTLEAFFRYDHAFYEFFRLIRLEGLSRDEVPMLLLELAKANHEEDAIRHIIEQQPGRVESLRIVTGGVIRTIVLLFEILTDDKDGTSMTDLEHVLDRVTPLYKHRMDDLEPHQRAVVNAIALNWDAISPEDIARKTRRSVDAVWGVLDELTKVFLVQRAPVDVHQDLYYLRERFFNIWYLMRVAPKHSQTRVVWLVRFLESWYDSEDLYRRAKQHIQAVSGGNFHPKAAYYLTEALARTGQLDIETEYEMKAVTRELLLEQDQGLAAELSPADQELLDEVDECFRNADYEKVLTYLIRINNKSAHINFGIALAYHRLNGYQKAEQYYLQAIAHDHVGAMYNLGNLYRSEYQDYKKAEEYYLQAIAHDHVSAMNNLAVLYKNEYQDYKKAEEYYLQAIAHDHVNAMNNLAVLYEDEYQDYEKAEEYYLQAIAHDHVNAMNNLAVLYFKQKIRSKEAIKYVKRVMESKNNSFRTCLLSCIYIWDNQIENALNTAENFVDDDEFYEAHEQAVIFYLMMLLAKKRYTDISAYFEMERLNLKERFKPLYYAFLSLSQHPDYHKLPPELSEPVDDILKQIQQLSVDYA